MKNKKVLFKILLAIALAIPLLTKIFNLNNNVLNVIEAVVPVVFFMIYIIFSKKYKSNVGYILLIISILMLLILKALVYFNLINLQLVIPALFAILACFLISLAVTCILDLKSKFHF